MPTIRQATVRELVPLLFVEDLERSLAFYRDRLGFAVAGSAPPTGKATWCRLERDGVALMLQQATAEDGPAAGRERGVAFYFICDDAEAIHAELTDRGLALPPPTIAYFGMKQVFVDEPDGYAICFESPTGA